MANNRNWLILRRCENWQHKQAIRRSCLTSKHCKRKESKTRILLVVHIFQPGGNQFTDARAKSKFCQMQLINVFHIHLSPVCVHENMLPKMLNFSMANSFILLKLSI